MVYSLQADEVKKVIDAKFKWSYQQHFSGISKPPYNEDQWLYYHLNRNYFNVKNEVKILTHLKGSEFKDNLGRIWNEVSSMKNLYHMPKKDYTRAIMGDAPYSRKFLSNDDRTDGPGGEFEMIIRHDGVRIGASINAAYQETYNYGRTANTMRHYILDMKPHQLHKNYYSSGENLGSVKIIEKRSKIYKPKSDSSIIETLSDYLGK